MKRGEASTQNNDDLFVYTWLASQPERKTASTFEKRKKNVKLRVAKIGPHAYRTSLMLVVLRIPEFRISQIIGLLRVLVWTIRPFTGENNPKIFPWIDLPRRQGGYKCLQISSNSVRGCQNIPFEIRSPMHTWSKPHFTDFLNAFNCRKTFIFMLFLISLHAKFYNYWQKAVNIKFA